MGTFLFPRVFDYLSGFRVVSGSPRAFFDTAAALNCATGWSVFWVPALIIARVCLGGWLELRSPVAAQVHLQAFPYAFFDLVSSLLFNWPTLYTSLIAGFCGVPAPTLLGGSCCHSLDQQPDLYTLAVCLYWFLQLYRTADAILVFGGDLCALRKF